MEAGIVVLPFVYQLDESWEDAGFVHHLKGDFIVTAIEEKEGDDEMKGIGGVFLDMHHQRLS